MLIATSSVFGRGYCCDSYLVLLHYNWFEVMIKQLQFAPGGHYMFKSEFGPERVALVDIDETLFDSCSVFLKHINNVTEQDIQEHDIESYDLRVYAGDKLSIPEILRDCEYIQKARLFRHAVKFIQNLREGIADGHKYHVAVVTHRGSDEDTFRKTKRQLESIGVPFDSLHVIDVPFCKLDHLVEYCGRVDLVVEDNVHILKRAITRGITTVCHARPWNVNVRSKYRVQLDRSPVLYHDFNYAQAGVLIGT